MIYLSHVKLSYTTLKWHTANKFLCYAFLLVFIRETSKFYPSTYPSKMCIRHLELRLGCLSKVLIHVAESQKEGESIY